MKVALNATCFNSRPSGANQRFRGLYGALIRQCPEWDFHVFDPVDEAVSSWFAGAHNVLRHGTKLPSEGRWQRVVGAANYWPRALKALGHVDLIECFSQPLVKLESGASVLTVHDVRRLRADWGWLERRAFRLAISRSLSHADCVITVSAAMRDEIKGYFPHARVEVVYNGLDLGEFALAASRDIPEGRRRGGAPSEFLLAVGHLERRKNYRTLIHALGILKSRKFRIPLVIVGNDNGESLELSTLAAGLGLAGDVIFRHGVGDAELRALYRECALFVFPSEYEGFGIPVLEAMAAGAPMLLSDIPVFREITEGRFNYVPPHDPVAMADEIVRLLTDSTESRRMTAYGESRVKDFSFDVLARRVRDVYESL